MAGASGCATGTCDCETGFTKQFGDDGFYCSKRYTTAVTYEKAKAVCQGLGEGGQTEFPKLRNNAELELYTEISSG